MKITAGPTLQRYADVFDVPIDEVVEWVNGYVNTPTESCPGQKFEPTEKDRLACIKGYIEQRLFESSDGRIRITKKAKKEIGRIELGSQS